jgi:hypothetical protein
VSSPGDSDIVVSTGPAARAAAVPAPRPHDRRDPRLRAVPNGVNTAALAGQRAHGSAAVLRRQPVRIVDGRFEDGYTDVFELICPDCGDNRDLDYSEVSWRLQWLRGPHMLEAGLAAYHIHLGLSWQTGTGLKLLGPGDAKPGQRA